MEYDLLNEWNIFEEEMNSSNAGLHKQAVLEKWKDSENIKKTLLWIYNPYRQYYLTKDVVLKSDNIDESRPLIITELSNLLHFLETRGITGHTALYTARKFIQTYPEVKSLFLKILNRDSELRVGPTLINKVMGKIIPVFDVQLCHAYEEGRADFENEEWVESDKLDGVRTLVISDDEGVVEVLGRSGKPFPTLEKLAVEVRNLGLKGFVFDGESCVIGEDGKEDFQGIMKIIKKKDHIIESPVFKVFDMIPYSEFVALKGTTTFEQRYLTLELLLEEDKSKLPSFSLLYQRPVKSKEHLDELKKKDAEEGREGRIIRKLKAGYEGKRTWSQMKVKPFFDCECKIIGHSVGPFRVIDEVTKLERTEEMLTNIIVDFKGFPVSVGSGFSIEQRREYYKNPEILKDKDTTIQYQNETANEEGGISLRFPVIKHIFLDGKRDI
jgi:DNA ligase-1